MNPSRIFRVAVTLLALAALPSRASEFLLAETSARALASAGAYAAAFDRLDCLPYNPAGLAGLPRLSGMFSHNQSFEDVSHDWLAAGMPLGPCVAAAEYLSWQVRPFTRYDENGDEAGQVRVESRLAGLAAAASFFESRVDLGAKGRVFTNDLAGYDNSGYAFDLGCLMHLAEIPLSAGFSLQNLGQETAYVSESDPLPTLARMGLSWHPQFSEAFGLDLRADWVKYARPDGAQEIRLGAEANLMKRLSAAVGAQMDQNRTRYSLGAAFDAGMFELAYAFIPDPELGATHQVSLSVFDLPMLTDK